MAYSAILEKAGLLDRRHATFNKKFFRFTTRQSDRVKWVAETRRVDDGPFVTSSGISAGVDMALAIIARRFGRERAQLIADLTEYVRQDDPERDPFSGFQRKVNFRTGKDQRGRN
jgi:transcriptional regulator GlxA family with amidase domain